MLNGRMRARSKPKKVCDLGAIVLCGAAQYRLQAKQDGHHQKEPGTRPLRWRQDDVVRRAEGDTLVLPTVPAQEIPSAKCREQQPDAAQQGDQREDAPDNGICSGVIVDQPLRRPIVRIRVREIRTQRGRRPCGPTEERRQLCDLLRIGDGGRPQSILARGVSQKICIVNLELPKRLGLRLCIRERASNAVVAIRFEVGNGSLPGCFR